MVTNWLTSEFSDLFAKNPGARIALWFDPKEEYARLLDAGLFPPPGAGFTVLRYRLDPKIQIYNGPLWLKSQAIWETRNLSPHERAARRYVLYLPFDREALSEETPESSVLDALLEYKYAGKTWLIDGKEPSLFAFLRKCGAPLPAPQKDQRALWDGGRDSLLAKYAEKFANRDGAFWKQPLDAAKANQRLVGDLDQRLFDVLADPDNAVAYLVERNLLEEFCNAVADEFGYTTSLTESARAWTQGFTVRLALCECFQAYGTPDDFPFKALVPEPNLRERWLGFWKRWTSDRDLADIYNKLVEAIEPNYNLNAWAKDKPGKSDAFRHLARARWQDEYAKFQTVAGSRQQLEEYAEKNSEYLRDEADGYWAKAADDLPGWRLLSELGSLVRDANAALSESDGLQSPLEFINAYARQWHNTDSAYWRIFQGVRENAGLEPVLDAAGLVYAHFLREINSRFTQRLASNSEWTGWGEQSVMNATDDLWKAKGKVAVIVADALRYDLAATLCSSIRGAETNLDAWVSNIPSITPVGMTSLLPLNGDQISAVLSSGKLELLHEEFGDLTVKEKRRKLVAKRTGAECMELPDILSSSGIATANRLVVFTSEIDSLGHKTGRELAKFIEHLVADLRIAVEKLHRWGYTSVHIVTDHGFILLADGGEKADSPAKQAVLKGDRYAFLAAGAVLAQFTLPFSLDARQHVAYAPGIACFGSSPEYIHGGISLQEVVIPHLKSWTVQKSESIGVECVLPQLVIATLAVKVVLVMKRPVSDSLLDQPQGRTMDISFLRSGETVSMPKSVALDPSDQDDSRSVTVFLDDQTSFNKGEVLQLRVRDAETQEDFAGGKQITIVRELRG